MTSPNIQRRPYSVQVIQPAYKAFAQASALCQMGYQFAPELPVELTKTGQAIFTMVLGQPGAAAVNDAYESLTHGNLMDDMQYQRDVEARAKTMLEDYKREQAAAALDALKAKQAAELAELERQQQRAIRAAKAVEIARTTEEEVED